MFPLLLPQPPPLPPPPPSFKDAPELVAQRYVLPPSREQDHIVSLTCRNLAAVKLRFSLSTSLPSPHVGAIKLGTPSINSVDNRSAACPPRPSTAIACCHRRPDDGGAGNDAWAPTIHRCSRIAVAWQWHSNITAMKTAVMTAMAWVTAKE